MTTTVIVKATHSLVNSLIHLAPCYYKSLPGYDCVYCDYPATITIQTKQGRSHFCDECKPTEQDLKDYLEVEVVKV